ncbi:nuclear transport factor 2 family protein [Kordiimonas pumila]|uniref:Nuclear transport factor 2 family protein n=1 Tax=Kordiimonas pumila TaxID=2161677 RepID=A0ABV7D6A5_9PROT|nr:nuclear transport factor 2 family protein [Kordiimonas pumila]
MLLGNIISEYYSRIDSCDIEWVIKLFAENAIYHRADSAYCGRNQIHKFFTDGRKIRGDHILDSIWSFDHRVICTGTFKGVGAAGDPRKVGFSDFWAFDQKHLVVERQTYLALGHQYVAE